MANDVIEQALPPRVSSQDKLLALVQKKYPHYHPVVAMVDLAHSTDDDQIELGCHKEVAKYLVAVDRFVEVKQELKQTKRVVVELFGGQDQPRATALEHAPSEVLDVTDVSAKPVEATVLEAAERPKARSAVRMDTYEEKTTVRMSGSSADDERNPLHGVWGDGSAGGAERFS